MLNGRQGSRLKPDLARLWPRQPGQVAFIRRQIVAAGVAATLLTLAGCPSREPTSRGNAAPSINGPALTWSAVMLARGVEPVTLTASGNDLLVGGRAANARLKPRLLRVSSDGSSSEIRLLPHSPYAFEAGWRSIVSDGKKIIAVGGAPGGAHSNTRWTTWQGTSSGVQEVPQPFDTFGGYGAGDVVGPVLTRAGPAIAGSWEGAKSGLDAAIWLPSRDRWLRQSSAGSALESTPELLVGPRSATSAGAGIVLPGSALHLSNGSVHQSAAVWVSKRLNDGWARVDLPDSGSSSEAVSAQCQGKDCLLAGYVDGTLAMWRFSESAATRINQLPKVAASQSSQIHAPLVAGGRTIQIVSGGSHAVALAGDGHGWVLSKGPPGKVTASALVGGWVYVIAVEAPGKAVLWRCPVRDLGASHISSYSSAPSPLQTGLVGAGAITGRPVNPR